MQPDAPINVEELVDSSRLLALAFFAVFDERQLADNWHRYSN
jgi:hypothetical protein